MGENNHPMLQHLGSFILLLYAGMLAFIGRKAAPEVAKDALGLTALYIAIAVGARVLAGAGYLEHDDAQIMNGLLAVIFGIALSASFAQHIFAERARNKQRKRCAAGEDVPLS